MGSTFRLRVFAVALALMAGSASQPVLAQGDTAEKIYKQTLKSTVWVIVPKGDIKAGKVSVTTGTGALVDLTRRLVLTNYHVVGASDKAVVLFPTIQKGKVVAERDFYFDQLENGGGIRGKVIAKDGKRDLALIQLDAVPDGAKALSLARDSVGPGQRVHSVGNPGQSGALWVYTSGTVRQVYHKKWQARSGNDVQQYEAQVVETQSPTNPGDSGGPLVNDRGELVAVTQGGAVDAQLLSFFIDVSEVKSLLTSKKVPVKVPPPSATASSEDKPKPVSKPLDDTEKAEQTAATKLGLAKTLAEDGKVERARERCQEIIKTFPKTKAAVEAKQFLEKLNK